MNRTSPTPLRVAAGVDVAGLIRQPDNQAARNYWKVLKNRLKKAGSQSVTNCNRLKTVAEDGKSRTWMAGTARVVDHCCGWRRGGREPWRASDVIQGCPGGGGDCGERAVRNDLGAVPGRRREAMPSERALAEA